MKKQELVCSGCFKRLGTIEVFWVNGEPHFENAVYDEGMNLHVCVEVGGKRKLDYPSAPQTCPA